MIPFLSVTTRYPVFAWNQVAGGAKARGSSRFTSPSKVYVDLFVTQGGKCALTGWDISFTKTEVAGRTASLDRIDSSKGYTKDNVQWVHKLANRAKVNLSDSDFYLMCKAIHLHRSADLQESDLAWEWDAWHDTEVPRRIPCDKMAQA